MAFARQALSYDFSSPYMTAAIVLPQDAANGILSTTNGRRIPLWTDLNLTDSDRERIQLGVSSLPYLASLTIEYGLGFVPKITAQLTPPLKDARAFLSSQLAEWGQSRLEVQLGYVGGAPEGPVLSDIFTGMMMKPEIQYGSDTTITLTAQGDGGWPASNTPSTLTYVGTRSRIIETLAAGPDGTRNFGVNFDAVRSLASGFSVAPELQLLDSDLVTVVAGGHTEWYLIQQLVREARCYSYMRANILYVIPRILKSASPGRTFRFYDFPEGKFGPSTQEFPILSYSSPTLAVYLASAAQEIVQRDISSRTKEKEEMVINDSTAQVARTDANGKATVPSTPNLPKGSGAGATNFPVGSPSNPSVFNQAISEFDNQQTTLGNQTTIQTLGIPDLQPGEVVAVFGIGSRLDTNYAILSIKHTVDSGGFGTEFPAISNVAQIATFLPAEFQGDDPKGPAAKVPQVQPGGLGGALGGSGLTTSSRLQEVFPKPLDPGF